MVQILVEVLHLNQVEIEVLDLLNLANQGKVVIKKRKKEVHQNGGEIVLDQEGLVEVIKLHQRKGVHLLVIRRDRCYHLNRNSELYPKQLYLLVRMIVVTVK